MAVITQPSTALPVAGDDMLAAQITDWFNAVLSFTDNAGNFDESNADLTSADGLVGKSTAQTLAGWKTLTKASITELAACPYSTDMKLGGVYVTAGEAITAGDLVYVDSWDSTNSRFSVKKAIATTANATTLYAQYVASAAIASAAAGAVYRMALLTTQVTTGLTAGRPVFLSTSGGLWTGTLPAAENRIQPVGFVVTVHASTGRVAIKLPQAPVPWSIADQI